MQRKLVVVLDSTSFLPSSHPLSFTSCSSPRSLYVQFSFLTTTHNNVKGKKPATTQNECHSPPPLLLI